MIYKINFNVVKQMLRKNLKKREILTCIRYTKGKIQFTDSYSFLELNNLGHDVEFTLDMFSGRLDIAQPYPDLERFKAKATNLLKVDNISITINDGITYYVINNCRYFIKRDIDILFNTIGKKITDFENVLQVHQDTPMLVVDVDGLYIMTLGVKPRWVG
jgi:hypothetical protein